MFFCIIEKAAWQEGVEQIPSSPVVLALPTRHAQSKFDERVTSRLFDYFQGTGLANLISIQIHTTALAWRMHTCSKKYLSYVGLEVTKGRYVLDKRDNESIIEDIKHWRYILGNLRTRPRDDYQTSGSVHVICWPFPMFRTSDDG